MLLVAKMKSFAFVLCLFVACVAAIDDCDPAKCKRPNCACSSLEPPVANPPQLVMLSFDDSAARLIYDEIWKPILFGRKNPDGCHIGGTFFVPHEYSDYEVVNQLYNQGFEIGSHSITKNPLMSYWKNVSKEAIVKEMGGQKTILTTFASIPATEITGSRLPLLQINENTFTALKTAGFKYDNSWPTMSASPYFPHTLDFASDMGCIGTVCQPAGVPGLWEVPIIDWIDMQNYDCNKLLACQVEGKEADLLAWMKREFERSYKGDKAPFSIVVNYAFFTYVENSTNAFIKFLDYLATLKDVFLVNESQVMAWSQNPVPKDKFNSCVKRTPAPCRPVTCPLKKGNNDIRYMRSCVACPKNYPWLDNPTGK